MGLVSKIVMRKRFWLSNMGADKMQKMIVFVSAVVSAFLIAGRADAETYLCVGEHASGFRFDPVTKEWKAAHFSAKNERYLIRKPNAQELNRNKDSFFVVHKIDENIIVGNCKSKDEYGSIFCEKIGGYFRLNTSLGRYMSSYEFGYIDENIPSAFGMPRNEGANTPSIIIGKCSRID